MDILISLGGNASDAHPKRIATTWQEFSAWLHQIPRSPAGLTPAEYAYLCQFPSKSPEGQRIHADKSGPYAVLADHGGNRRALDTMLGSYGVPLDFDTGWVTAEIIDATLAGYAYVRYTTYAHLWQPGAERWRVFVPTSQAMDAAQHRATWTSLSALFGGAADIAAKDASRLSYLPGKCLYPEHARIATIDGTFFPPTQATAPTPPVLQPRSDGPVPGWAGPLNDDELLTIACTLRLRPDEKFGGPIHFLMLWTANEQWLAEHFPPSPSEAGQPYSRTQADMALAGELSFFTGSDRARMEALMLRSGLARQDDDWRERKVPRAVLRAIENAKSWYWMRKDVPPPPPPPMDGPVTQMTVDIGLDVPPPPPPPNPPLTALQAVLANVSLHSIEDFFCYHPTGQFIYRPTGILTTATTVDNVIGKDARIALYSSRPVHKMTWAPGHPERFQVGSIDPTDERGKEAWLYNTYQPPRTPVTVGDPTPWLELIRSRYPDDLDHIVHYCADAVQFPQHKCNHALVLGSGVHGVGKDTMLAPVRHAVGERNYWSIKPNDVVGAYNPFLKSVVLQISESRDLGEGAHGVSRYDLYERTKDLWAAPPKMLTCNDKYIAQHPVLNVCRGIMTTNHLIDGIYLPPEDRRHYCAWSDAEKLSEDESNAIWEWYAAGGLDIVANYLATLDLTAVGWNRTAPPPQTAWWHMLVEGGKPAEDERFNDALDKLGRPDWLTLAMVAGAGSELAGWMGAPGNKRKVEREMDKAGYRKFPNPHDKRGRWFLDGARVPVYRRMDVRASDLLKRFNAA